MSSLLCNCAFISCLVYRALSQVSGQLTFDTEPVYIGESVTLTCHYGSGVQLLLVTLDAFNGTRKDGFLWCTAITLNTTSFGVFKGSSFTGCPAHSIGATNVSVTLTATPSLELDYNCTAVVADGSFNFYSVMSEPAFLPVFVLPSPPTIAPISTTFNQSDNAVVTCQSLNGKPAANVSLLVSMPNGTTATSSGIISSSLTLSLPIMDWHNATVTCSVTNHNFSNMTVTKSLLINHIRSTIVGDVIYTNASGVTLNCSTYVRSFPGALYSWRTPKIGANFTASSDPSSTSLQVPQGQSGSFDCTATNIITMENVTIVFIVGNVPSATSGSSSREENQKDKPLWVIGLVLGIIAVVTIPVVFVVLRKRGKFLKRTSERGVKRNTTEQRSSTENPHGTIASEQGNVTDAYVPSIDRNYESLHAQPTSEPTYSQLTEAQQMDGISAYENVDSVKPSF